MPRLRRDCGCRNTPESTPSAPEGQGTSGSTSDGVQFWALLHRSAGSLSAGALHHAHHSPHVCSRNASGSACGTPGSARTRRIIGSSDLENAERRHRETGDARLRRPGNSCATCHARSCQARAAATLPLPRGQSRTRGTKGRSFAPSEPRRARESARPHHSGAGTAREQVASRPAAPARCDETPAGSPSDSTFPPMAGPRSKNLTPTKTNRRFTTRLTTSAADRAQERASAWRSLPAGRGARRRSRCRGYPGCPLPARRGPRGLLEAQPLHVTQDTPDLSRRRIESRYPATGFGPRKAPERLFETHCAGTTFEHVDRCVSDRCSIE